MSKYFAYIGLFCLSLSSAYAADLTITVGNIQNKQGTIRIAVFAAPSGFPEHWESSMAVTEIPASQSSVTTTFTDLPENSYAISVYHDMNNNGQLDKNFFGIPKEPYGFSGKGASFGPPSFSDAKISLGNANINLDINLE